jgi:hypothetical protein
MKRTRAADEVEDDGEKKRAPSREADLRETAEKRREKKERSSVARALRLAPHGPTSV